MKWASIVTQDQQLEQAIKQAIDGVHRQLGGSEPDLLVAFVSQHHHEQFTDVPALLAQHFGSGLLIGCSAGGVIGGGREVEQHAGFSLTAALLPDVKLTPFHLDNNDLSPATASAEAWEQVLGVTRAETPHFVLLPDPFSCDANALLKGLDQYFPESCKIGGLASGGNQPASHALYLGNEIYRSGVVGLALSGNIQVDTLVAQGCRPIGDPLFVTKAQQHMLLELDGKPPIAVLNQLYGQLNARDQELLKHSLFLGITMRDARQEYRQGDFLIRNIIGMDKDSGALGVGAVVPENSVVQFHLRDAKTSAEDLELLLSRFDGMEEATQPKGSLLFSCLGRGMHLYGHADHDTDAVRRHLGEIPLGGFFCNGEIGPVQGTTFLHGYTSSFGLFSPRRID